MGDEAGEAGRCQTMHIKGHVKDLNHYPKREWELLKGFKQGGRDL